MAKGLVQVAQRCGRYAYRKVMVRVTNPDHYEPSHSGEGTGKYLKVQPRYGGH